MYKVDIYSILQTINSIMNIIEAENSTDINNENQKIIIPHLHKYEANNYKNEEKLTSKFLNRKEDDKSIISGYYMRYDFVNKFINGRTAKIKILLAKNFSFLDDSYFYVQPSNICVSSDDELIIVADHDKFILLDSASNNNCKKYETLGNVIKVSLAFFTDDESFYTNQLMAELILRYIIRSKGNMTVFDKFIVADLDNVINKAMHRNIINEIEETIVDLKKENPKYYLDAGCETILKYYINLVSRGIPK